MALAAVVALAAGVRLFGLDFGLPHSLARPDERRIIGIALGLLQGDPNPHFFRYPSLYLYLLAGLYGLYYLVGRAGGRFEAPADLLGAFAVDPTPLLLLDRALSAAFGLASVLLVYALGRELADRRTGLAAALFLALSPLHVRDSHFGVTDVAATTFVLAAVLGALRAHESGRLGHWAAAGLAAGLAASTKYFGFLVGGALLASEALALRQQRRGRWLADAAARGAVFAAAALLAFAAGTPFALLDPAVFADDVGYEVAHLRRGHRFAVGFGGWHHLRFSLPHGLGPGVYVAALAGIPLLVARARGRALVALAFPALYGVVVARGHTVFARYVIPLLPFLCVAAAVAADRLARLAPRGARASALLVPLLLVAPSARCVLRTDALLARTDNRVIVGRWFQRHVPPGASVLETGSRLARLELPRSLEALGRAPPGERPTARAIREAHLAHQRATGSAGYPAATYDRDTRRFRVEGAPSPEPPDYVVVQHSPLRGYSRKPPGLSELLSASYRLVAAFPTGAERLDQSLYDAQDAFFLPFACPPPELERPGPAFAIYRRR